MRRYLPAIIMLALVLACLLLTACAPGKVPFNEQRPAGFLWGFWHGLIAPISIIWHFFDHSVHMYETNNNGVWYDIGFYLAVTGTLTASYRAGRR